MAISAVEHATRMSSRPLLPFLALTFLAHCGAPDPVALMAVATNPPEYNVAAVYNKAPTPAPVPPTNYLTPWRKASHSQEKPYPKTHSLGWRVMSSDLPPRGVWCLRHVKFLDHDNVEVKPGSSGGTTCRIVGTEAKKFTKDYKPEHAFEENAEDGCSIQDGLGQYYLGVECDTMILIKTVEAVQETLGYSTEKVRIQQLQMGSWVDVGEDAEMPQFGTKTIFKAATCDFPALCTPGELIKKEGHELPKTCKKEECDKYECCKHEDTCSAAACTSPGWGLKFETNGASAGESFKGKPCGKEKCEESFCCEKKGYCGELTTNVCDAEMTNSQGTLKLALMPKSEAPLMCKHAGCTWQECCYSFCEETGAVCTDAKKVMGEAFERDADTDGKKCKSTPCEVEECCKVKKVEFAVLLNNIDLSKDKTKTVEGNVLTAIRTRLKTDFKYTITDTKPLMEIHAGRGSASSARFEVRPVVPKKAQARMILKLGYDSGDTPKNPIVGHLKTDINAITGGAEHVKPDTGKDVEVKIQLGSNEQDIQACPWKTPHDFASPYSDDQVVCEDGEVAEADAGGGGRKYWKCAGRARGGRAICPPNLPVMCNDKTDCDDQDNTGHTDFCCKEKAEDCTNAGNKDKARSCKACDAHACGSGHVLKSEIAREGKKCASEACTTDDQATCCDEQDNCQPRPHWASPVDCSASGLTRIEPYPGCKGKTCTAAECCQADCGSPACVGARIVKTAAELSGAKCAKATCTTADDSTCCKAATRLLVDTNLTGLVVDDALPARAGTFSAQQAALPGLLPGFAACGLTVAVAAAAAAATVRASRGSPVALGEEVQRDVE